jgi:hypothetical protein
MVFIVSEKSSLHPSSLDRAVKDCISGWSVLWRHFDRQFLLKAGFADINVTAVPNKDSCLERSYSAATMTMLGCVSYEWCFIFSYK